VIILALFHKKNVDKDKNKKITEGEAILQRYKNGKANLEDRIINEEKAWRLQMWQGETNNVTPSSSAYMWNAVVNKHADLMDNYPIPALLPREESDKEEAKMLTDIIPVVLERNDFEETYSNAAWYKLKHGTSCYGVFWDSTLENGMGDISIKNIDLLRVFWDPTVSDIQKSPNLFICAAVDTDVLKSQYPDKDITSNAQGLKEYESEETIDRSNQSLVVDWYYKVNNGTRDIVHYIKYTGGTVLYSSEEDSTYSSRGLYDHGMYPLVVDTLYPEADSLTGYGVISVTKDAQMYIDVLDSLMMEYAKKASTPRWFKKKDVGINEDEFADWKKPFITVAGDITEERFKQLTLNPLPGMHYNLLTRKVEELKETIGNRDVNSGGTGSGVTSGAAIATLQEAGNKTSRDAIKTSYRAYVKIIRMVIELMRQFYTTERTFRILGVNDAGQAEEQFVTYSNEHLASQPILNADGEQMVDEADNPITRMPIFDIDVKAQKTNPYSKLSQNETASNLYQMGVFNPENAQSALMMLSMMDFEGKAEIVAKVSEGQTLMNQIQQMQAQMQELMGFIQMLRTGSAGDSSAMVQNDGTMGGTMPTDAPSGRISGNPIEVATKGAERTALTDYGQELVDRGNNIEE
jgi:hypothetical protein